MRNTMHSTSRHNNQHNQTTSKLSTMRWNVSARQEHATGKPKKRRQTMVRRNADQETAEQDIEEAQLLMIRRKMAHKLASEAALCYNKLRNNVALAMLETSQGWISLYERNTMNTLPPRAQDDNPPQKRCPKCHRWLPFSAFSTANAAKDGLY